ncbi:MAG: sulfite exporter TauE/SafE family protein [Bacteroidales bacterium]|nr:sulfite exporter TauE/SafE family protein [Bacteroidales bacterium]
MDIFFLENIDIYSWQVILILILAGFFVGVINTLAGSGTIITYSLFMLLGLPANLANGTIRLGVIMQTLAASLNFKRQNVLEIKKGIILGIPVVLGSIAGAQIAASINENIFEKILGGVMLLMLLFIFYDPKKWIQGQIELISKKTGVFQVIIFFLIGLYGGFIHIGVGIFLLAGLVLNAGYDLVKANAIKVFIVLLYSPFALTIFIMNNQVDYWLGAVSAIGNIIGGIVASQFAVSFGAKYIRWILIIIIIAFSSKLLGII